MTNDRLREAVPDGEALRYATTRRRGGAVGLTDERLLVVDDEVASVDLGAIEEVTARRVDWFVAVLSVALVGVGILAGGDRPLVGAGFVAGGVASLLLVYRKRGKVTVSVRGHSKPVTFHLDSTEEFLDRLEGRLDRYEQRLAEE